MILVLPLSPSAREHMSLHSFYLHHFDFQMAAEDISIKNIHIHDHVGYLYTSAPYIISATSLACPRSMLIMQATFNTTNEPHPPKCKRNK